MRLTITSLDQANHHEMVGSTNDPKDGAAVAGTVFTAVFVYMVSVELLISVTTYMFIMEF